MQSSNYRGTDGVAVSLAAEMEVFDGFPLHLRRCLANARHNWSAAALDHARLENTATHRDAQRCIEDLDRRV